MLHQLKADVEALRLAIYYSAAFRRAAPSQHRMDSCAMAAWQLKVSYAYPDTDDHHWRQSASIPALPTQLDIITPYAPTCPITSERLYQFSEVN
jgi:hypothetical protein